MHIDRYEILTLYYGEDVTAQEAQETAKRIKGQYSPIEIEVVDGGQPYYPTTPISSLWNKSRV